MVSSWGKAVITKLEQAVARAVKKVPGNRGAAKVLLMDALQRELALEDEALAQYAEALGLDARRLMSEVLDGAHAARVREDFRSGARGGVNGTPTFFINGVRYEGAPEAEAMVAALLDSD